MVNPPLILIVSEKSLVAGTSRLGVTGQPYAAGKPEVGVEKINLLGFRIGGRPFEFAAQLEPTHERERGT